MKASREYGEINLKKTGCDFGCDFCPFLSTFVHMCKQQRPPKLEAFTLKILKLRLYARGDSNPQPLAPEANALSSSHQEVIEVKIYSCKPDGLSSPFLRNS